MARNERRQYVKQRREELARHEERALELGKPWEIRAAVVLERLPIVVRDLEDWYVDFKDLQWSLRAYGRTYPKELELHTEEPESAIKGLRDLMQNCPIELAPRKTAADEANDRTSLDRALAERLCLLVRPRDGSWAFPSVPWAEGETIRDTAERALKEAVVAGSKGSPLPPPDVFFVGNCPAGYWAEASEGGECYGTKTFFHRCQLVSWQQPPPVDTSVYEEHAWVTKSELSEYLDGPLAQHLRKVL